MAVKEGLRHYHYGKCSQGGNIYFSFPNGRLVNRCSSVCQYCANRQT